MHIRTTHFEVQTLHGHAMFARLGKAELFAQLRRTGNPSAIDGHLPGEWGILKIGRSTVVALGRLAITVDSLRLSSHPQAAYNPALNQHRSGAEALCLLDR